MSERSRLLNLIRFAHAKPTAEELEQLGNVEDATLATRFGRTVEAVRVRRGKLDILTACDHRRRRR